ncbi:hypothetical protein K432DRAFT_274791, partial [Lepidopterella palustris CBS 459.81]
RLGEYAAIKSHTSDAVDTLSSIEKPNIMYAAEKREVPYYRLQALYQGRQSMMQWPGLNQSLNSEKNASVISYINYMDRLRTSALLSRVNNAAQCVL